MARGNASEPVILEIAFEKPLLNVDGAANEIFVSRSPNRTRRSFPLERRVPPGRYPSDFSGSSRPTNFTTPERSFPRTGETVAETDRDQNAGPRESVRHPFGTTRRGFLSVRDGSCSFSSPIRGEEKFFQLEGESCSPPSRQGGVIFAGAEIPWKSDDSADAGVSSRGYRVAPRIYIHPLPAPPPFPLHGFLNFARNSFLFHASIPRESGNYLLRGGL